MSDTMNKVFDCVGNLCVDNAICNKCGHKCHVEFRENYFDICTNCYVKFLKECGVGMMEPIKNE